MPSEVIKLNQRYIIGKIGKGFMNHLTPNGSTLFFPLSLLSESLFRYVNEIVPIDVEKKIYMDSSDSIFITDFEVSSECVKNLFENVEEFILSNESLNNLFGTIKN